MLNSVVPFPEVQLPTSGAPRDVVEGTLDVVARLLNAHLVVVSRIESTTYTLMAVVDQEHVLRSGQFFDLNETFCIHMLEAGQPLRIDDTRFAAPPIRAVPSALDINVRSYVGVPLHMPDGRVFGSLWAADPNPHAFTDQDAALLQLFARLLCHEIEHSLQEQRDERIGQIRSMHTDIDSQTGLLGRASFEAALRREIARRQRYGNTYAVAVLTLERPAAATDRYGQHSSTTLCQSLADILMRTSRLVDSCAHIAPDQFAVLFPETTASGVESWRTRIEAAVATWNRIHRPTDLSLELGIGVADCHDATDEHQPESALINLAVSRASGN